jgi:predicted  nucleic acid-binding Zn-ribbon protein
MRSAKERLEGNSYGVADPGLHALAEAIDELAGRVDQIGETVEAKETDHDALSGLLGRYDETISDLRQRLDGVEESLDAHDDSLKALREQGEDLQVSMRQYTRRIEVADSRSREARRAAKMANEDNTEIRDRDETLADRIDELQNNINEVWSRLKSLSGRLDNVEKGQDLQDTYMNDLRDAAEEAKAGANKALERLVAHAKTHQQLRQAIKDVEQQEEQQKKAQQIREDFEQAFESFKQRKGLDEELNAGDSWGGWHDDEQKANPPARDTGERAGEDLPHARHHDLVEDVRAVFPNADIAVRESNEQPGLDFEVDGVSYYVDPNRSVGQKVDGWKLERNHRAWLVERALTTIE